MIIYVYIDLLLRRLIISCFRGADGRVKYRTIWLESVLILRCGARHFQAQVPFSTLLCTICKNSRNMKAKDPPLRLKETMFSCLRRRKSCSGILLGSPWASAVPVCGNKRKKHVIL